MTTRVYPEKKEVLKNEITKKTSTKINRKDFFNETSPLRENQHEFSSVKNPFSILMSNLIKKTKNNVSLSKKNKKRSTILKNSMFFFGALVLLATIGFVLWFSTLQIPDISSFDQRKISNSTKIYDRTGEIVLYDIHENIRRTVVPLNSINSNAQNAIIAIEDHTFYEHNGVVVKSTLRAIGQTIFSKLGLSNAGTAGGSTITQQIIKNTLLNSKKQVSRKVKEWVLAYKIENKLTKDQILEIYLNEAPYGGTIYGIQEASKIFFGVNASELSLAQSAYLAAIPNLPTFYSPYGPNKEALNKRKNTVLQQMKKHGYISDEEYRNALEEEVVFLPQESNNAKALHFVEYLRAYLEKTYGADMVQNGGLKVISTLDYELQQKAEKIITDHINEVETLYDASNAALVAIESKTGQILTMVGSRDYFNVEAEGNFNVVTALRQPGSAFKPIAYANAFNKGYLPETVVFDVKTQFVPSCDSNNFESDGTCYAPNNHDQKFNGPLSLRNALGQSRNIPAVKTLYLGGINDTLKLAQELGITSLKKNSEFYGLGLVLGGGEVSLLELTNVYATFAREGSYTKTSGILSVEDSEGNVLEAFQPNETQVLSENVARMISSILSDNVARTPLFGSQSFMNFGSLSVAAKTGTTNDNRDAWLIGYTPNISVGVWTGNNDNSPMKRGSSISGKPWRQYMDEAIKKYPSGSFTTYSLPENFNTLPGIIRGEWKGSSEQTSIDTRTGLPADDTTPEEFKRSVNSFDPHTILHYISKDNPTVVNTSRTDPQYRNWEAAVQSYTRANFQDLYQEVLDTLHQDLENQDNNSNTIVIRGLRTDREYDYHDSEKITLGFNTFDINEVQQVDFFVNNTQLFTDTAQPYSYDLEFSEIQSISKENTLKIVILTKANQSITLEQKFTVINIPINTQ